MAQTFSQGRQCAPPRIAILIFSNDAKKAVLFIGDPGGEKDTLAEWHALKNSKIKDTQLYISRRFFLRGRCLKMRWVNKD
jgi:hypothetical protein